MQYLNKLSTATIGLDKDVIGEIVKGQKKAVPICRFLGTVNGLETGESANGPWVKFKGLFSAVNYSTGEECRSGACLMPAVASNLLEGLFLKAKEGEGQPAVTFAYEISAKPEKTAATGYVFTATSLVKGGADPLGNLIEQLPPIPKTKKLAA